MQNVERNAAAIREWMTRTYGLPCRKGEYLGRLYFFLDSDEATPPKIIVLDHHLEAPDEAEVLAALERDVRRLWPVEPAGVDLVSQLEHFLETLELTTTDGSHLGTTHQARRRALRFIRVNADE